MTRNGKRPQAPYKSLRETAFLTGLSVGFLRTGCKSGKIPHVKVGQEYRVNMPLLLEQLEAEARAAGGEASKS